MKRGGRRETKNGVVKEEVWEIIINSMNHKNEPSNYS